MSPPRTAANRRITGAAAWDFQSSAHFDHITTPAPPRCRTIPPSAGLRAPNGGRIQKGCFPVIPATASSHWPSSRWIAAGEQNARLGCVCVWFPIACPRAPISRTSTGSAAAYRPIRKKVAFASCRSRRFSRLGVTAGFGPSSNVRASVRASLVKRIVRPKICDPGANAPQANTPAAAQAPAAIPIASCSTMHGFSHNSRKTPCSQSSLCGETRRFGWHAPLVAWRAA